MYSVELIKNKSLYISHNIYKKVRFKMLCYFVLSINYAYEFLIKTSNILSI